MDWEEVSISLYLMICKEYEDFLWVTCQRFTNGGRKSFTDEEAMLLYADAIEIEQDLKVFTPITKARGQKTLEPQQKIFSKAVSRMRQPIETLFGWIQKTTGIQCAGLVRSSKGLLTHIFGRFAAAMIKRSYPLADF